MQLNVSFSMAEGELIAVVEVFQVLFFAMRAMEDIGLHMMKWMILCIDCKGALDLTYGWRMSGLMKHVSF